MNHTRTAPAVPARLTDQPALPQIFLSCYELTDVEALRWDVRLYRVHRTNGAGQSHGDRGDVRQAIWSLRKKHQGTCRGYGFVIDLGEDTAAVPAGWQLPSGEVVDGFLVTFERAFRTDPANPAHRAVIIGILREAIKRHFKDNASESLGLLWQDYDRFCQLPERSGDADHVFCRKFGVSAKALRGNRWVLQLPITTATIDARTFREYYRDGHVADLAAMIEAKQANRLNRRNRPVAVRVLRDASTPGQVQVVALELLDPGIVSGHGSLTRHEQAALAEGAAKCCAYGRPPVDVRLSELRLILDSQITRSDHAETIIEPEERQRLAQQVRDFVDGMDAYGQEIRLSAAPVDAADFPQLRFPPPALRVRHRDDGEALIEACTDLDEGQLGRRGRARLEHVKRHGFLLHRPVNPLVAWPSDLGWDRARRMRDDLNYILRSEGIEYSFTAFLYRDVEHLNAHIRARGFDALLAVLPEGWRQPFRDDDTHEAIKRRVEVPSQCIHFDHTLPESWIGRPHRDFATAEPRLAKRIRQRYELCVWNLLVKHHWVPFAPADPFSYNVQVGLDVGGRHNNRAMACLGYGFSDPRQGLLFRPEEIPIDVQKAEPIPTNCLFGGLLQLFESVYQELSASGLRPDFDRSLFLRDGMLLGDGDAWNERDAIVKLHATLRSRDWVSEASVWTVAEVMKHAEEWRVLRGGGGVANPLVGYALQPFVEDRTALVCTTGAPYLTQGTASPLKVSVVDIHGEANLAEVIRNVLWGADMCYSKVDIGMSLPWVLHVSDAGALQLARSYRITGITT
jgi:hypothetical protein